MYLNRFGCFNIKFPRLFFAPSLQAKKLRASRIGKIQGLVGEIQIQNIRVKNLSNLDKIQDFGSTGPYSGPSVIRPSIIQHLNYPAWEINDIHYILGVR